MVKKKAEYAGQTNDESPEAAMLPIVKKTPLELMTEQCARLALQLIGSRVRIHDMMIAILDGRDPTEWEDTPQVIDEAQYYRALQTAKANYKDRQQNEHAETE